MILVSQRFLLKLALLTAAYYATGKLGLSLPYVGSQITLFWLPAGIAIAALLRWGYSFWPGIFVAATAVNFSVDASLPLALGIAIGNTLGPLLCVRLLQRLQFNPMLSRLRDTAMLAGAAALGMAFTAVNGIACLLLAGRVPLEHAAAAWLSWWTGDWLGVLLAAPVWLTVSRTELRRLWPQRWELLLWLIMSSALGWTVFFLDIGAGEAPLPLAFIIPAFLVWAAISFGISGSSFGTLIQAAIAVVATLRGFGPFQRADMHQGLWLLWLYLVTLVLVQLFVAALQARRRQAEQLQRAASEKMHHMIAASPTVLFASRVENNRLTTHWVSGNVSRILGYGIDEVLQADWWMMHIHPEDRQQVLTESAALFGGMQQAYEYRFMHKNGAERWIRDEQQPVYDAAGQLVELLSAWNDITERKHEELELRIAATAFETQEAIIITDQNNRILRTNRAFTRLTGYSAEEAIGQTPSLLNSGRQDAAFYRRMWAALEHDRHWEGEIWNRRKNGEIFPEWLIITAIADAHGKITRYVATFSDITQMKKNEAEIHSLAFYDPLTQLPNRRLLYDRIAHALAMSSRSRQHGALIFLDLDHFKILNDTQGHAVGDQLLIEAGRRLQSLLREIDTVARLGGDEFVVMLEDLSADPAEAAVQARTVAEKIGTLLNQPYRLKPNPNQNANLFIEHSCSTSIGVTLFPDHDSDLDELMKRADMAMYQAKRAGRNAVCFFDPRLQSALLLRTELDRDLRAALDNNELCLHYQLQVDAKRRPVSAEALLRWRHPQRGDISPEDFIPLCEENGLIISIGNWVLEQACTILRRWSEIPSLRHLFIAVNVSARQFNQPDFVSQLQAALQNNGADPTRLKLEITESLVLGNPQQTVNKMLAIKELGVNFVMDDFGTGYSSLSYLQRLPLEQMKIDSSFIHNLHTDSYDAAFVRTILTLGNTLAITTIAEGVETHGQHVYLAEHGCQLFQGFLYNRPMPLPEFETHLLTINHNAQLCGAPQIPVKE